MAAIRRSTIVRARTTRQRGRQLRKRTAPIAPSTGRNAMDRYLEDLQALPLLSAAEEVALAAELERLVVAHWRALLSYGPARQVVFEAIMATPEATAPLARLASAQARKHGGDPTRVAQKLRRLDRDCVALMEADRAVQEAFVNKPRARAYLKRAARARAARLGAKGRFVTANLRLVIALARRYERGLLPLSDLIQEGNLGLLRAVDRFDYRRGFRFSTYAAWWIRHALNRGLSNKGRTVRLPVHALDDMTRIRRAIATSQNATGVTPTELDLAASTGISVEKIARLQGYASTLDAMSLDKQIGDDRERTLHDVLPANDGADIDREIDLDHWREELGELLTTLSPIEATTLRLRFGLDGAEEHRLRDIGHKYNLSRERIRQIQNEALGKLRDAIGRRQRQHDDHNAAA